MEERQEVEYKLYKRRWVILALFFLYALNGSSQWLQFSIIGNDVKQYYNVTDSEINITTTVSMLIYIILVFPSLHVMDKVGVRNVMIIGSAGVMIGTWVKVFSADRDRFNVALFGQVIMAIFQVLTFSLSARFTALWFGADEISIAGAWALFGDQLGTALGFLLPSIMVKNDATAGNEPIKDERIQEIGYQLQTMFYVFAGFATVIFIMITLLFKSKPKLPPSAAQVKQLGSKKEKNIFPTIKSIIKKRSFIFILLSYSLNLAAMSSTMAHLDDMITMHFGKNQTEIVSGHVGFVLMLFGIGSSLTIGNIVDRTRKFKESAVLLTAGSALAYTGYTLALKFKNTMGIFIAAGFLGLFAQGYYATGFQMAIEVTFPVSEEISSAILILFAQFFGLIFIWMHDELGNLLPNIALIVIFSISLLFACLVPADLRRQDVEKSAKENKRGREGVELVSCGTVN